MRPCSVFKRSREEHPSILVLVRVVVVMVGVIVIPAAATGSAIILVIVEESLKLTGVAPHSFVIITVKQ